MLCTTIEWFSFFVDSQKNKDKTRCFCTEHSIAQIVPFYPFSTKLMVVQVLFALRIRLTWKNVFSFKHFINLFIQINSSFNLIAPIWHHPKFRITTKSDSKKIPGFTYLGEITKRM